MAIANKIWGLDSVSFNEKFIPVEEVLKQAKLDFDVTSQPVFLANGTKVDKCNAIVREDTNQILGTCGDRYELLSNKEAFAFFQPFVENKLAYIDNIGAFKNGLTFIQAKVCVDPQMITKGDEVESYITLLNSFNGTASITASFLPRRLICTNQMPMLKASKHLKVKHTKNCHVNLETIQKIMDTSKQEFVATCEQYRFLQSKGIDKKQLEKYVKTVFKKDETDEKEMRESKYEKIETIFDSGRGLNESTRNYWGAFSAITEYLNHETSRTAESRLQSLWVGVNAGVNQRALDVATQMAAL